MIAVVGVNYRSRIAELRSPLYGMNIQNKRRHIEDTQGRKHAALGAYCFTPYEPLGRDSGTRVPKEEPTLFELTPFDVRFTVREGKHFNPKVIRDER